MALPTPAAPHGIKPTPKGRLRLPAEPHGFSRGSSQIDGRYFSTWWFDRYRPDKAENKAMAAIIWQLLVNNLDSFGFTFNEGTEAQLDLQQAAEFIGGKLNTWSGIIVKEFRSMAYLGYGIEVCDACGLNSLYLKLDKAV